MEWFKSLAGKAVAVVSLNPITMGVVYARNTWELGYAPSIKEFAADYYTQISAVARGDFSDDFSNSVGSAAGGGVLVVGGVGDVVVKGVKDSFGGASGLLVAVGAITTVAAAVWVYKRL